MKVLFCKKSKQIYTFFFFDPNHKTARKSQHKGILKQINLKKSKINAVSACATFFFYLQSFDKTRKKHF